MEEEDYVDLEFDDACYTTTWSMINMWYRRAHKLQKQKEEQVRKDKWKLNLKILNHKMVGFNNKFRKNSRL